MKDELRKIAHLALWLGAGIALYSLVGCGATHAQEKQAEDAIHWFSGFLPAPLGGIANSFAPVVGTLLAMHGTKHVRKHLAKRREAKKTQAVADSATESA